MNGLKNTLTRGLPMSTGCGRNMIVYTADGLQRMSHYFNLYESDPSKLDYVTLGYARDKAEWQYRKYLDRAYTIADRLCIRPTWYKMTTPEIIERCRVAHRKWLIGQATPADMVDAMNYCMYQADMWGDEIQIINMLAKSKE